MNLRKDSRESLSNKYLNAFKVNKEKLLDLAHSAMSDENVILQLLESKDSEAEIIKKLHEAKISLESYDFPAFWNNFLLFLTGEVKTKTEIKNFIELSNKEKKSSPNLDGRMIVLSSLFIKGRSDLQESLYDYTIENYQNNIEKEIINSEISDFIYSILSILKIVLDEKSKIEKLILDDITSSLMTAYNLTNKS
jgi:hypothetical protein